MALQILQSPSLPYARAPLPPATSPFTVLDAAPATPTARGFRPWVSSNPLNSRPLCFHFTLGDRFASFDHGGGRITRVGHWILAFRYCVLFFHCDDSTFVLYYRSSGKCSWLQLDLDTHRPSLVMPRESRCLVYLHTGFRTSLYVFQRVIEIGNAGKRGVLSMIFLSTRYMGTRGASRYL